MKRVKERIRPEKAAMVGDIAEELDRASYVWMADFTGLDMPQTSDLRARLRQAGGRYRVVKNRLLRQAAKDPSVVSAARSLTGATALVTGEGEGVEVARALLGFVKEHNGPKLKAGVFDGKVIGPEDIRALGDLPSKTQLHAMLAGVLAAPMTQLAGVLNQKLCSLVYVLKAVEEKKGGVAAASPEA